MDKRDWCPKFEVIEQLRREREREQEQVPLRHYAATLNLGRHPNYLRWGAIGQKMGNAVASTVTNNVLDAFDLIGKDPLIRIKPVVTAGRAQTVFVEVAE